MTKKTPTFEYKTCGRCGGSGEYSFNLMHGTRCYGCGGTGFVLTKRGAAAQAYLDAMRKKRAADFVAGDLVYESTVRKFYRITEVKVGNAKVLGYGYSGDGNYKQVVLIAGGLIILAGPDDMYRTGFDAETKAAQVAKALEYQSTLTANGKVKA